MHGAGACRAVKACTHRPAHCAAVSRRWTTLAAALAPLISADSSQRASAAIIDETAAMEVFAVVAPSVVTIQDITTVQGRDVEEGVGSGFVWDKYGHIVTNSHVISQVAKDQTGTQVGPACTLLHSRDAAPGSLLAQLRRHIATAANLSLPAVDVMLSYE